MIPTILVRISFLYNLLNSFLLFLIPKKLRGFLPQSWYTHHHLDDDDNLNKKSMAPAPAPWISTRMNTAELKRVFQVFDKNSDGRITKEELNDSLESLGIFIPHKDLTQIIQKIDVDGDGCIDIDEFGSLYDSIVEENEADEEDMREAFQVFDENGDGFITADELKSVLASLGLKQGKTLGDCKKMIMAIDVDGDDRVSYKEFRQMMRGGGLSALN